MPSKATTATTSSWLTSAALPLLLLYYTVAEASQGPSELLQSAKKFSKREKDGESTSFSLDTTSCEGYSVSSVETTSHGIQAHLSLIGTPCLAFGVDYEKLLVDVEYQTEDRLRVHIYDADQIEFQVPETVFTKPLPSSDFDPSLNQSSLVFNHQSNPFAFWITRRDGSADDVPIFDTRPSSKTSVLEEIDPAYGGVEKANSSTAVPDDKGALVFESGYLEISSYLPKDANIYGLGEVIAKSGFRRDSNATVQTMWARDVGDPEDQNMYGDHPVYLETRFNGSGPSSSHGVFLLSSEGMDIVLRHEVIEYRPLGGSLDFYFIAGPTPVKVIEQYSEIVGKPALYPYWSYGFHLCRWGYNNITENRQVVEAMENAQIPLETFWNDIDYMDAYRNWVPAPNRFNPVEYKAFVDDLHTQNRHYIPIVDAAIAVLTNDSDIYAPYTAGTEADAFIKNPDGSQYIGKVWPGFTVFPDFFNNGTQEWWTEAFLNFSETVAFDGIWLDMNEPSSFCEGSCGSGADLSNTTPPFALPGTPGNIVECVGDYPEGYNATLWGCSGNLTINGSLTFNSTPPGYGKLDRRHQLSRRVGQGVDVNSPAYEIHNALDKLALSTVSPNATQQDGQIQELDIHNLFGTREAQATYNMWSTVKPGKRPFIISRSTFAGAGRVTGHWLGDNYSQWKYLRYVNQGILQFQLFGIPLVGADTCGFNGNTDEELCNRWFQLAAFHPFHRVHNTKSALPQEPYRWDSVAAAARNATAIRYSLLPYWYTLFHDAHTAGTPPVRALFYEFDQEELLRVDAQFLVGSSLLVTAAMYPNVTSVEGHLPGGEDEVWRDWHTHEVITPRSDGNYSFPAPLGHIPVSIRSGSIFLLHSKPGLTVYDTQQSPYALLVSLNKTCEAEGKAFVDDGESWPATEAKMLYFGAQKGKVYGWAEGDYKVEQPLGSITVLGVESAPSNVTLNGKVLSSGWAYDNSINQLQVDDCAGDLNAGFELCWS